MLGGTAGFRLEEIMSTKPLQLDSTSQACRAAQISRTFVLFSNSFLVAQQTLAQNQAVP